MPRTEKKFGQVRRAASGQLHELAPIASTTRNVLLNLTSNTSTTTATVITTTGPISRQTQSATATVVTGSWATILGPAGNMSYEVWAISPGQTAAYFCDDAAGATVAVTFTPSTLAFSGGTTISQANLENSTGRLISLMTDLIGNSTQNQTNSFTSPLKFLDETYVISCPLTDHATIVADANAQSGVGLFVIFDNVGSNATVGIFNATESRTPYLGKVLPDSFAGGGNAWVKVWGIYRLYNTGAADGLGYVLGSTGALSDTVPNASAEALTLVVIKNGAVVGRLWWNSTAGRTSGDALSFYQSSDYNTLTGQYVFSHSNNASNQWLSRNGDGSSGATFATGAVPYLPTRISPAGFRIVENDGALGENRKWLDGSVTIPPSPTGVTVPTSAQLLAAGLYCPVAAVKFSPNGYYLAVAYNLKNGTSVDDSHVVIYSKQEDNSWVHTHSSGTSITIDVTHNDAMVWSSDSATISIAQNGIVQTWSPGGLTNSARLLSAASTTLSLTGIYPNVPSIASVSASDTFILSAGEQTFNNSANSTAETRQLYSINRGEASTPAILLQPRLTSSVGSGSASIDSGSIIVTPYVRYSYAVTASAGTTYQNTVAQSVSCASGVVTQISNIVLSPGEGLYVEPGTNARLEAVAYGVEIT